MLLCFVMTLLDGTLDGKVGLFIGVYYLFIWVMRSIIDFFLLHVACLAQSWWIKAEFCHFKFHCKVVMIKMLGFAHTQSCSELDVDLPLLLHPAKDKKNSKPLGVVYWYGILVLMPSQLQCCISWIMKHVEEVEKVFFQLHFWFGTWLYRGILALLITSIERFL